MWAWRALADALLSVFVPICRVCTAHEGGGGRLYLLTDHLRPGEQWLRQLLHQTGALRAGRTRMGQDQLEELPGSSGSEESGFGEHMFGILFSLYFGLLSSAGGCWTKENKAFKQKWGSTSASACPASGQRTRPVQTVRIISLSQVFSFVFVCFLGDICFVVRSATAQDSHWPEQKRGWPKHLCIFWFSFEQYLPDGLLICS